INGVLMGTVMGYLVMNTLQIILVHVKTLKTGLFELVKLILVNIALSASLVFVSSNLKLQFNDYLSFLFIATLVFITSVIIVFIINALTNVKKTKESINIVRDFLKRQLRNKQT
ncbi:MAG: hypothetical protein PHT83_03735, partial [Bacilli bacterium]|nr:hypothetical protein [Bacilli bacterium]